jgi:predicted acylesterase/phospholipase RssA
MLLVQPAGKRRKSRARIGLAIAGGGPLGGMYELGGLRALEDAIEGLDLTRIEVYVGVSSGAFLAAGLANRMTTEEMCRIFITGQDDRLHFRPEAFLRPAMLEYMRRATGFPALLLGWWRELLSNPGGAHLSDAINRFGGLVPNGLFDNTEVERFLRDALTIRGRSNDFRELDRPLYVVAVDLNRGEAVTFGSEHWKDVPISRAVQASAAMPGLYPPVEIRGRQFVDGALRRTMNASIVLKHGIDLLLGINPLVPFDTSHATALSKHTHNLADGGLPVVLSQTLRTLLQSRAQVGIARYAQEFPQTDQLVLEPNADDSEMFFTNVLSFSARTRVCEHAYRSTLADLHARRAELAPLLARHGLRLREDVIADTGRSLVDGLQARPHPTDTTARLRRALDDVDHAIKRRKQVRRSA